MILEYSTPQYNPKTDTWEIRIKVKGQYDIYTQIVTFETLASANKYIEYIKIAKGQREKQK